MKRIVPDKTRMEAYLNRGLTQAQIAEQYEKDTGIRVSRAAIGMAIGRYGLESNKPRPRYEDMIPWKLNPEHLMATEARLLRFEARRRRGLDLSKKNLDYLNNWLDLLAEKNAVVDYDPDAGFRWVERRPGEVDIIRRPEDAA